MKKNKETILGYDIARWGLFFHLASLSRQVIKLSTDNNQESFMLPLAEELDKILMDVFLGKKEIPGFTLSLTNRVKIITYLRTEIEPTLETRRRNPPVLMLAIIHRFYEEEFMPLIEFLGMNVIYQFIQEFMDRATKNDQLHPILTESSALVGTMLDHDKLTFKEVKAIKLYKTEFASILESSYDSLSHGMSHIDTVLEKALKLNRKYNLQIDIDEIIVACLFHDMYDKVNRKEHHLLGAKWIASSIHPMIRFAGTDKQVRIAKAIEEHRASYTDRFTSKLSELLATADREEPDIIAIIQRAFKFQVDKYPTKPHNEKVLDVINHLEEKYSSRGYINYTYMFMLEHKPELLIMQEIIDKIVAGKIKVKIGMVKSTVKVTLIRKGKLR